MIYLEVALQSDIIQPPFSNEMNTKFLENGVDSTIYIIMFQEAYQLTLNKLKKHIDHHSALPLFKAIQYFNPHYIHAQQHHCNISLYLKI